MKIQILQRQIESRRIKHVTPPENVYVPLKRPHFKRNVVSNHYFCGDMLVLMGLHFDTLDSVDPIKLIKWLLDMTKGQKKVPPCWFAKNDRLENGVFSTTPRLFPFKNSAKKTCQAQEIPPSTGMKRPLFCWCIVSRGFPETPLFPGQVSTDLFGDDVNFFYGAFSESLATLRWESGPALFVPVLAALRANVGIGIFDKVPSSVPMASPDEVCNRSRL